MVWDIIKLAILMGSVGTVMELWYTAFCDRKQQIEMFFLMPLIYAIGAIPFYFYFNLIDDQLMRLFAYGITILSAEYIIGKMWVQEVGDYPWFYDEGMHFHHLIRLDYFPLWAGLGFLFEKLNFFLFYS